VSEPNPGHVARIRSLVNSSPYFDLLSMQILDIGLGYAKLEILLQRKHLQPFGVAHGGVYASIIDAAAFWSVYFGVDNPRATLTTVDLKLNYLAPASEGKLLAKGRQIKVGRRLAYAEAEVADGRGRILAHGTSTLIILTGRSLPADPPLPPKFNP
jgi:uncharacterized protein (TIGR00369 family)